MLLRFVIVTVIVIVIVVRTPETELRPSRYPSESLLTSAPTWIGSPLPSSHRTVEPDDKDVFLKISKRVGVINHLTNIGRR